MLNILTVYTLLSLSYANINFINFIKSFNLNTINYDVFLFKNKQGLPA